MQLSPALAGTISPPVMEARRWIAEAHFPHDRPLLNLSQAAPVAPPPAPLQAAMVEALRDPATHLYGPVLGLAELRDALARNITAQYGGHVGANQIAITSGCNQAFCAAIASLAGPGDAVILPTPWYFNHAMWLQMQGIAATPLACGPDLLPDPDMAARLITPSTRAIVLVTPNNPTGVEYPPQTISAFRNLARKHGLALIIDETYRDFHSIDGPPHALFADPDWDDTLIHLYSFSKAYRLTGHRVGAIATSVKRLEQIEKFLDAVTICPTGLGQRAALWGLNNLGEWLAAERTEILRRRKAMQKGFAKLSGWTLRSCGAYFGYVSHPSLTDAAAFSQDLVSKASLLVLPGTMFTPDDDLTGRRHLRIAFANADCEGIAQLTRRLAKLDL